MLRSFDHVVHILKKHDGEFAEVHNPSYVYPPREYYPLASPNPHLAELKAILMDMDGTTTTTEVLCIHSLEMMLRRMSGKLSREDWGGIDRAEDLEHIIGNSTTKHVEYLLKKYSELIAKDETIHAFIAAAVSTLVNGQDEARKNEVVQHIKKLGMAPMVDEIMAGSECETLISKYAAKIPDPGFSMLTGMGIDIYYAEYHRILARLGEGDAGKIKEEIPELKDLTGKLIAPMPGIPLVIPLVKGWLGAEAHHLADILIGEYETSTGKPVPEEKKRVLKHKVTEMGKAFEQSPAKLGLVTSSIFYEADIVMGEVMREVSEVIAKSSLGNARKDLILQACEDYHRVYDAFVTASDSSEIRLKPHRDLYSLALHHAGIQPEDFDKVVGFEDSQSGTVAIRAAGIGCCVAVPFAQTASHDLGAATHILPHGIPQAILEYGLFFADS